MASVRERNGRFVGLYRDSSSKQRSAGTYDYPEVALAHAVLKEREAHPPAMEVLYRAEKHGVPTVAAFGPLAIAGSKLEATSRETYSYSLKHVVAEFGGKALDELTPAEVRTLARKLDAKVAAEKMASSTARHVLGVLRLVYSVALQDYPNLTDPTEGVSVSGKGSVCHPVHAIALHAWSPPPHADLSTGEAMLMIAAPDTQVPITPPEIFPCNRQQARGVRAYVHERVTTGGRGRLADDAVTVASELFGNAVNAQLHQGITTVISVQCMVQSGLVTIDIYDHAEGIPYLEPAGVDAEAGRGLHLVDILTSRRWGWQPYGTGKVVSAMLGLQRFPRTTPVNSNER